MSTDGPSLLRMSRVLEERAIPVDRVLRLVELVGAANVYLGLGTFTERVQLLVPSQPEAVALIAPSATMPERSMLLVSAHHSQLDGAAVIGRQASVEQAVDTVAPPAHRQAWREVLEAVTTGSVRNATRYLTAEHATITLSCPPRTGEAEAAFAHELDALTTRLGVPADWRAVYAEAGEGDADLALTTECTPAGLLPRLGLRFGQTRWDRAIDLAKAMGGLERVRGAAVRMGMLAAQFETDTIRGVETIHDAREPDVVVWLKLRQS